MRLVYLGTSAAMPTSQRSLTCICLEREGEIFMFDAGEGAQNSFTRFGFGWNRPLKIFVTHMHGDHCIGILGLLQTMSMQQRSKPVEIYGPQGIEKFIGSNVESLGLHPGYSVIINAIDEGTVLESDQYIVKACPAEHSIPAFSYVFEEKDKRGRFLKEKAIELGIPEGHLWGKLQRGHSVRVGDRVIEPDQVLGEKRRGRRIGISGDTRPTKKLEEFFHGCNYLSFDSTFSDELREKARLTHHSTAKEAGQLAKNADVQNLILTHFSARYSDVQNLVSEAEEVHGSVIAAHDQMEIKIE